MAQRKHAEILEQLCQIQASKLKEMEKVFEKRCEEIKARFAKYGHRLSRKSHRLASFC